MEEPAFLDVRAVPPARPELEPGAALDDVAEHLAVAVVMPARRDAPVDAGADEEVGLGGERELAHDPRSCLRWRQSFGADGPYSLARWR